MEKTLLLASFIHPERVNWFLNYLEDDFKIPNNFVFQYRNLDDETRLILTFKLTIPEGKFLNLKELFPNALTIHKRGNALYTINALNKLIEEEVGDKKGNINYKTVNIKWDEYQNKMIIISGGNLSILNIERVF